MHTGNSVLIELIRDAIRRQGPVTFEWFMEQALYHPELGYYSSGRCSIGQQGDYFTNVSVGSLFGQIIAAQFVEMWKFLGRPDHFMIVEQGAHHGDFARDLLDALRARNPDFFSALHYSIIEPFSILENRQEQALRGFVGKVTWKKSPADLDPFCGVHFSNELVDSMPVHLISRAKSGWQERRVAESGDGFELVGAPITSAEMLHHLKTISDELPAPYETEMNLASLKWIEGIAPKLNRGYVLAVDYGYSRDEYYAPERSCGTLRCYAHHRLVPSPFTAIGDVDITAHVDWTSLALRAEKHGLDVGGFVDQYHFVTGVATALLLDQFEAEAAGGRRRALQTLLHPELLGRTFQLLALTKDVADFQLSGFKFARDARVALGL